MVQLIKNPPAMRETWVQSLGWEDPLKGTATLPSILAWRSMDYIWGRKELDVIERLSLSSLLILAYFWNLVLACLVITLKTNLMIFSILHNIHVCILHRNMNVN